MKTIRLLCIAIFGMIVGSAVINAYACDDSLSDDLDFFKICAEHNQSPSHDQEEDDDESAMTVYNDKLLEEFTKEDDDCEHRQQLFSGLQNKIQFLHKDISLKMLQNDYLAGSIEKELFEKIVVDNSDDDFVEKLEKQLQCILRNPVGRAIIRCIIECKTEDKIVFVPIDNFFDKKTQTTTPPALSVIDGDKYITITVPTNMEIGPVLLIGLTKNEAPAPTIITSLHFHSALAHELIHCAHRMYEKSLYIESKTRSAGVTKAFAYAANIDNEVLDFDMSEELYAVLGIRASDSTTQNVIYRLEQSGDLAKYIKDNPTKLTACSISELMRTIN